MYASFLTARRRRREVSLPWLHTPSSQASIDSASPYMNTSKFPASPSPPPALPASPSLRRRVLGRYMTCSCSKEALYEEPPPTPQRVSPSPTCESIQLTSLDQQQAIKPVQATPPTLSLPDNGTLNTGLGWTDEFGITITKPLPPRPGRPWSPARPKASLPPSSPPSSPPQEASLPRSSRSSRMPSPQTVLDKAVARASSSSSDSSSFFPPPSKGPLTVRFLEHFDDAHPPRLDLEHPTADDWAAGVLSAVGE